MKANIKHTFIHFLYWLAAVIYLETLLHGTVFGEFTAKFGYVAGFSVLFAAALTLLITLLPKKLRFASSIVVTAALIFLYGSQMVYNFIFGTLYSVSQMQLGGAALTAFWRETMSEFLSNLLPITLLLLPLIGLILLRVIGKADFRANAVCRIALIVIAAAAQCASIFCLSAGGTGFFTDYYFYHSADVSTDQVAERFGLLTAFRLELTGKSDEDSGYYIEEETESAETAPGESTPTGTIPQETVPEETEPAYNVLEIDFDALNELTEDETILALNDYCASLTGTQKNEYTGMLSDYNLIVLCAESFSPAAIQPDVTPTLYKLATEGIIFNNYYNAFPNTTTDGEYTMCMGIWPDISRKKSNASFYASRENELHYCLGNLFLSQRGIQSYGYHNYFGTYYHREETHPNMGYSMKFANDGMKFTCSWPASDYEMMLQSVDDYIGQEQFHAYYMTFSGHYRYDSENPMVQRNWSKVKNLNHVYSARAYLSCHIELDKALEYLMQRLEEEGIADRTAIVLAGDHFPYGLSASSYSSLVGYEIDDFSKFKSSLIFWVGGLEENIIVDEYCCNVDILPTILNLWGFDYDSRLLAGTDVFSDGTHVAILRDMSFYTDKVWFNSNTGEIRYQVDESEVSDTYIENMIKLIKTRFSISKDILDTDYYGFIFGETAKAEEPTEAAETTG